MSTSIIEALQNAEINFRTVGKMGAGQHPIFMIAMEQLSNAVKALQSGMEPYDTLQERLFGEVITDKEE